ncbi:hypothetical protein QCA50_011595 [Cerrena zonata]|uniref:Uncharacterized protein n=1 Tax=Cerrena zonata TaxID=2478898 RepID=A0AAW0G130_9APHY
MSLQNLTFDAMQRVLNARYFYIAITSAWVWDALVISQNALQVFAGRRIALSDIAYFLSRLFAAIAVLTNFAILVTRLHDCNMGLHVVCWSAVLAICFSMLLILICVNGIFFKSRMAQSLFSLLWVIASLSIFSTPFAFAVTQMEPMGHCALTQVEKLGLAGPATVAIFEMVLFVSVSCRVVSRCTAGVQQIPFSTSHMRRIWKALWETGQLYFLPLLIVKIGLLIVMTSVSKETIVLVQYQGILILADGVLLNIMACRVYHSLTAGVLQRSSEVSTQLSSINFRRGSIDSHMLGGTDNGGLSGVFTIQVRRPVKRYCIFKLKSNTLIIIEYEACIPPFLSG